MIAVSYDKQLRAAFAAGQASLLPKLTNGKVKAPATYEEWIEHEERNHIPIVRG